MLANRRNPSATRNYRVPVLGARALDKTTEVDV